MSNLNDIKLCIDCRYYTIENHYPFCTHPTLTTQSAIDGSNVYPRIEAARHSQCGVRDAKLFEQKLSWFDRLVEYLG